MLFHDEMPPAAVGTGHRKQESQQQHHNCVVCHQQLKHLSMAQFQVAEWYSALSGDPPPLNAVDYGWEANEANEANSK